MVRVNSTKASGKKKRAASVSAARQGSAGRTRATRSQSRSRSRPPSRRGNSNSSSSSSSSDNARDRDSDSDYQDDGAGSGSGSADNGTGTGPARRRSRRRSSSRGASSSVTHNDPYDFGSGATPRAARKRGGSSAAVVSLLTPTPAKRRGRPRVTPAAEASDSATPSIKRPLGRPRSRSLSMGRATPNVSTRNTPKAAGSARKTPEAGSVRKTPNVSTRKTPIKGGNARVVSLIDCLDHFIEPESLETPLECTHCARNQDSVRRIVIEELPRYLALHLKRTQWNATSRGKITTRIDFPLELDTAPLVAQQQLPSVMLDSRIARRRKAQQGTFGGGETRFRLVGVVNHHGSAWNSGHYTATCRTTDGEWHSFNDAHVHPVDEASLTTPQAQAQVYILMYERLDVGPAARAAAHVAARIVGTPKLQRGSLLTTAARAPVRATAASSSSSFSSSSSSTDGEEQDHGEARSLLFPG
jgi:hypothetical protein